MKIHSLDTKLILIQFGGLPETLFSNTCSFSFLFIFRRRVIMNRVSHFLAMDLSMSLTVVIDVLAFQASIAVWLELWKQYLQTLYLHSLQFSHWFDKTPCDVVPRELSPQIFRPVDLEDHFCWLLKFAWYLDRHSILFGQANLWCVKMTEHAWHRRPRWHLQPLCSSWPW